MTRRQAILRAATELFAERGFNATPTAEVARRAKVAEGTIFHHFKNKEGMLGEILLTMLEGYLEGIERQTESASSGLEAVEKLVRFHFRFADERAEEFLVVLRDFPIHLLGSRSEGGVRLLPRLTRAIEILQRCIARGVQDGSIRDVPPRETALLLRGLLNGLSRQRLLGPLPIPDLSEQAIEFCRRSLSSTR